LEKLLAEESIQQDRLRSSASDMLEDSSPRNIRQMRFLPCGAQLMLVGLYEEKQTAQLEMYNPIPSGKLPFCSMIFLLNILLCFYSQVSLPDGIFL